MANGLRSTVTQMHSYYKLLPTENVREDEETILDVLTAAMNEGFSNGISLLNLYREVPINFKASVDNIEKGMVEMTVHQLQAAVMNIQKETIIRGSQFKHDVVAKVTRSDPDNGFAMLAHFSYVQMLADRRAHVRVTVSDQIEVTFRADQLLVQGRLQDISVGGMAINAPEKPEVKENKKGEISVSLHGSRLQIQAILLRIADACPEKVYAFMFTPDSRNDMIISQFVFQTQSEVIRELKDKISL